MGRIWTEEHKYRCWLQVESAASAVLAEDGVIPASAAEAIARAGFSVDRIREIEAEVKHDVIAFTTAVAETMKDQGPDGQPSRWLHYGLTSNDVVDTAQALQVGEASGLIHAGIDALLAVLK